MSEPKIVIVARIPNGKATHYFVKGGPLAPICGRLKGAVDAVTETDDDVTCKACVQAFEKDRSYSLEPDIDPSDTPAGGAPDGLGEPDDEDLDAADEDLEGAEEDDDEESEKSYSKAVKFQAFAQSYGWRTRIKTGYGSYNKGQLMTFVIATRDDVEIKMGWAEGRYQYNESRIIKGEGEVLNAFIRNASAARGYVNAINIAEDATRPVLIRKQGGKTA